MIGRLDTLAVLLLLVLAAIAAWAIVTVVDAGYATGGGLALLIIVGIGFIGFAPAPQPRGVPRNTYAHGAARIANEDEALMAASRHGANQPLDTIEFDD